MNLIQPTKSLQGNEAKKFLIKNLDNLKNRHCRVNMYGLNEYDVPLRGDTIGFISDLKIEKNHLIIHMEHAAKTCAPNGIFKIKLVNLSVVPGGNSLEIRNTDEDLFKNPQRHHTGLDLTSISLNEAMLY